jgi:hypothetical protein
MGGEHKRELSIEPSIVPYLVHPCHSVLEGRNERSRRRSVARGPFRSGLIQMEFVSRVSRYGCSTRCRTALKRRLSMFIRGLMAVIDTLLLESALVAKRLRL